MTGVLLSEKGTKLERETDVAMTLMARDYKGFGNQAMTGVMEVATERERVNRVRRIGNVAGKETQSRTVYDSSGLSPTLCAGMDHGNTMPYVEETECKVTEQLTLAESMQP